MLLSTHAPGRIVTVWDWKVGAFSPHLEYWSEVNRHCLSHIVVRVGKRWKEVEYVFLCMIGLRPR